MSFSHHNGASTVIWSLMLQWFAAKQDHFFGNPLCPI